MSEQNTSKRPSKNTIIILVAMAVLLPTVIVLAILNARDMEERLQYHVEGNFSILIGGGRYYVSLEDLVSLEPVEVTSSPRGEHRSFTGVSLAAILEFTGADYSEGTNLVFNSIDGFRTAITMAEALNPEASFIVFEENGVALGARSGHWQDAPFMLVMARDPFANRWARYVFEIEIQ